MVFIPYFIIEKTDFAFTMRIEMRLGVNMLVEPK